MPYLECRHIFAGGRKCKAPALTGQPLCYFHDRAARGKGTPRKGAAIHWDIGPLEDADTIQLALSEVLGAIANGQLDPRRGGLLLYGLQVAAGNVKHARSYRDRDTVREIFPAEDGASFGPTVQSFDAADYEDECSSCAECSSCDDECDGECDCDCHEEERMLAQAARLTGFKPPR